MRPKTQKTPAQATHRRPDRLLSTREHIGHPGDSPPPRTCFPGVHMRTDAAHRHRAVFLPQTLLRHNSLHINARSHQPLTTGNCCTRVGGERVYPGYRKRKGQRRFRRNRDGGLPVQTDRVAFRTLIGYGGAQRRFDGISTTYRGDTHETAGRLKPAAHRGR